ncbi:dienelactone hydrolase [Luteitalea sp. TBR-22]|uniref:alpha/beta hydrolase family protein n=1 Tax=Luteitalea sp. TBR-22 TaxID=2802971 RepID=UPI001AF4DBA5|nr:alpha/beta fold hydrolase [Luteitalea sp. TBR-22]BCS31007.1 dienelactone hydrolase [Luteitalea sp. TBR-22]
MANSVGLRRARVPAAHLPEGLDVIACYPSIGDEQAIAFGPYTLDAVEQGVPTPGPWPVVVVSHGSGGSPLTHRGLARHLASAGWLVLLPTHPGNNRDDNSLANGTEILVQRPRDVSAVIDWAASPDGFARHAETRAVGVVGHSMGGYTALALAGGRPYTVARDTPGMAAEPIPVDADPRVTCVVLLAPAAPWFIPEGSLSDVTVPVLPLTGALDAMTGSHGDIVNARLPATTPITSRVVPGAGHFSFLTPFPAHMTNPAFPPSQDPPGSTGRGSTRLCIQRSPRSCGRARIRHFTPVRWRRSTRWRPCRTGKRGRW